MKPDVAIIGAGYVGMPLAKAFAEAGRNVLLRDVKVEIVDGINRGESHIGDVPSGELKRLVAPELLEEDLRQLAVVVLSRVDHDLLETAFA